MRKHPRLQRGFTLIELMIVVAMIGILASVAIPSFIRYIRKTKTAEAVYHIRRIYEGGRAYLLEENAHRGSIGTWNKQFPEPEAITPAATCCNRPGDKCIPVEADWQTNTWQSLQFGVSDPHYFRYEFASTGSGGGNTSSFTARALGDLDCDGQLSTFEMIGLWNGSDMTGAGVSTINDLE